MRKITVEECTSIDVETFRKMKPLILKDRQGVLHCQSGSGSIRFRLSWGSHGPTVTLRYEIDQEMIAVPVPLLTTHTQFGGRRWWLKCPLAVNGTPCHRRAGQLFLPPGGRYFGCRECHQLSYRSSQDAHQMERLSARLGLAMDTSRLCAESLREST